MPANEKGDKLLLLYTAVWSGSGGGGDSAKENPIMSVKVPWRCSPGELQELMTVTRLQLGIV